MAMKIDPDIYGRDETGTAQGISGRILGVPDPTLDIHGEKDERAVSQGNHGVQGGGRSDQGEPTSSVDSSTPSTDGKTG